MKPSASTFSFAPTTLSVDGLGRPAEGVVHLVAHDADGAKVASGVVLDARGTIATTAAAVARRHRARRLAGRRDASTRPSCSAWTPMPAPPWSASAPSPWRRPSGWAVDPGDGRRRPHRRRRRSTARVDALGVNASTDSGQVLKHLVRLDIDDDHASPRAPRSSTATSAWSACAPTAGDDRMYAVPIEIPRAAARSINVHGRVVVPWLGVSGDDGAGTTDGAAVRDGDRRLARQRRPGSAPATRGLDGRRAHGFDGGAGAVAAGLRRRRDGRPRVRARRLDVATTLGRAGRATLELSRRSAAAGRAAAGPRTSRRTRQPTPTPSAATPTPARARASSCLRFGLSIVHQRASVPAT